MKFLLPLAMAVLAASPAAARLTLVCQTSARIPYSADRRNQPGDTRVFTQVSDLLEERRSGNSIIYHWTVIQDRPDQLVAIDSDRALTLIIDRPSNNFAESGTQVQRRGYCAVNELP